MRDDRDEPCPTCGGERTITEDRARGHDHYTVELPCPDCGEDEYRELDGPELDALEKSFWSSLARDDSK